MKRTEASVVPLFEQMDAPYFALLDSLLFPFKGRCRFRLMHIARQFKQLTATLALFGTFWHLLAPVPRRARGVHANCNIVGEQACNGDFR